MKRKLFALCTLLFCAHQLYGMEQQPSYQTSPKELTTREILDIYKALPIELKRDIIISALAANGDIDQAVDTIENTSMLYGVQFDKLFNNLKDFTALMNVLAKKFPTISRREIAKKFTTPIARTYINLYDELKTNVYAGNIKGAKKAIEQGADVKAGIILHTALLPKNYQPSTAMIKLLLEYGADPFIKNDSGKNALEFLTIVRKDLEAYYDFSKECEKIKPLLEEAMQKPQT
jgi:hypothetical protein